MEPDARRGSCACGDVAFEVQGAPLIVHGCHCLDCQRLSGGPFVVHAWIEARRVKLLSGRLATRRLFGGSGRRREVASCENCGTAVWSRYEAAPGDTLFVRVATLERSDELPPQVHLFTRSKRSWVELPSGVPSFEDYYELKLVWPPESLKRLRTNLREERERLARSGVWELSMLDTAGAAPSSSRVGS